MHQMTCSGYIMGIDRHAVVVIYPTRL